MENNSDKSALPSSWTTFQSPNLLRYIGFHLTNELLGKQKKQELNKCFGILWQLLRPKSKLWTDNKLTIYKTILWPIWTYGIELWGSAQPSNIYIIQCFQSKVLHKIHFLIRDWIKNFNRLQRESYLKFWNVLFLMFYRNKFSYYPYIFSCIFWSVKLNQSLAFL